MDSDNRNRGDDGDHFPDLEGDPEHGPLDDAMEDEAAGSALAPVDGDIPPADGGGGLQEFSSATTGTLKVGSSSYAVGLFWHAINNPGKAAQEARAAASQDGINADFFCHPYKGSQQVGLGLRDSSHKAGMPVLATHLMSSQIGRASCRERAERAGVADVRTR